MTPLIFLDVDGVLNGHDYDPAAESNTIERRCVVQLNRVLRATGAAVVLSSAWRYMIHGGSMDVRGFGYMLRTHGVAGLRIVGLTCRDEDCVDGRGAQISRWLADNPRPERYVVLDDDEFDIPLGGHPLVLCDGKKGLTVADADRAIEILMGVA